MDVTLAPGQPVTRLTAPVTSARKSSASGTFRPLPESARDTRPNQADALLNSFVFISQKVPTARDLSGPIAALRLASVGRSLTDRFKTPALPVFSSVEEGERFTRTRLDFLDTVRRRLTGLQEEVRSLSSAGAFNTRGATVSDGESLQVEPGATAPFSDNELQPLQLAQGQVLASNVLNTGTLGLSGEFRINGVTVSVETSDSVFDIRDKINLGEDVNGNGILDGPEDLNENGSIDVIDVASRENGAGAFTIEDFNGNGLLEGAEDLNDNNRLDGGVQNTGVVASIERGRLLLTSLTGGASAIDLSDEDGVLLELGFFELNAKGLPIQKEVQFDFSRINPVNLNTAPQSAELNVNGDTRTSFQNQFDDALEDARVTLAAASENTITVSIGFNAEQAVAQIQSLFDNFNAAVSILNEGLSEDGLFDRDLELQSLRLQLTGDPQVRLRQAGERNDNIEALAPNQVNPRATGLTAVNTEPLTVSEVFATRTNDRLENGERLPLLSSGDRLFQRLSEVGIRTLEDDTVAVNADTLRQALETNEAELQDLFFNESTGVVPLLETRLENLLTEEFGRLDLKVRRIEVQSNIPDEEDVRFRRGVENTLLEENVRNLLAVA